jgi:hypothetical protein
LPRVAPEQAGGSDSLSRRVLSAQAALQAAQAKVQGAEDNFRLAYSTTNDPQYLAAQAEVQAADKQVQDAKRLSDGYGQARIDATEKRKEAQEKVAGIISGAMSADPAVAAARRELEKAQAALRQASEGR